MEEESIKKSFMETQDRFYDLSCHESQWRDVPETVVTVLLAAAKDDHFDMMLLVDNFLHRELGENVSKRQFSTSPVSSEKNPEYSLS
jgi:hypothetical protein